jgi:hypothetical protein
MTMNAAEMDNLARATIKECVKAEVRQLVQENLAAVLTELLAELRGSTADISDGQLDASDGQPDKEVAARTALPRKLQASHETQSVHMSYTADPVSPVCEGYMCGHTYTSLCASEVELIEGVDLVTMSRSTLLTWPCVKWTTLSL